MQCATDTNTHDLNVRMANNRTTWICTMRILLDRGLIERADVERVRDDCMDVAGQFAASHCEARSEFGFALIGDLTRLFRGVIQD